MFGWFNSSGASPVGRVGGTIKLSLLYTRESLLLYIVCTAMIVDKQERGDMCANCYHGISDAVLSPLPSSLLCFILIISILYIFA